MQNKAQTRHRKKYTQPEYSVISILIGCLHSHVLVLHFI